ncbi:MAG: hypothetical protein NDI93_00745 [Pseudomonas sp.]|nr:hypothetical protein [Pseudomonas sp.]
MSRHLAVIGILISAIYLALACFLVGDRLLELRSMELNAVGDFFAGIFGPLSILWLVLGFFQQGMELRQNNKALELQAAELKNSVEQQRELVDVAREQMAAEIISAQEERKRWLAALEPIFAFDRFYFKTSGVSYLNLAGVIINSGNKITEFAVSSSSDCFDFTGVGLASFMHGEKFTLRFKFYPGRAEKVGGIGLRFSYRVDTGDFRFKDFLVVPHYNENNELRYFERAEVV